MAVRVRSSSWAGRLRGVNPTPSPADLLEIQTRRRVVAVEGLEEGVEA